VTSIFSLSAKIPSPNSLGSGSEPSIEEPDPNAFCGFNKADSSDLAFDVYATCVHYIYSVIINNPTKDLLNII
jgi:hypothetical protein